MKAAGLHDSFRSNFGKLTRDAWALDLKTTAFKKALSEEKFRVADSRLGNDDYAILDLMQGTICRMEAKD